MKLSLKQMDIDAEKRAHLKAARDQIYNFGPLSKAADFLKVNKSTVFHWMTKDIQSFHRATVDRILQASKDLIAHRETPMTIRFAIIKHATEMLPVHLLDHTCLSKVTKGVNIRLVECESIEDCLEALRLPDKTVDIVVAPRQKCEKGDQIQKLCKLVEVPVNGIFALPKDGYSKPYTKPGPDDLRHYLNELSAEKHNMRIGCLPNADYASILQHFLQTQKGSIEAVQVSGYQQAVERLIKGELQGVIGHSVFIANCWKSIENSRIKARGVLKHRLECFDLAPAKSFEPVKLDIFVNMGKKGKNGISPQMARKCLELFYDTIAHMKRNIDNHSFTNIVDKLLNLSGAPAMSGKDVIKEYIYEIKTFETNTLLNLWK